MKVNAGGDKDCNDKQLNNVLLYQQISIKLFEYLTTFPQSVFGLSHSDVLSKEQSFKVNLVIIINDNITYNF